MDAVAIGTDTPVTKNLKGVSLKSALRLILHELDLQCAIHDGALLITTKEAAENMLVKRTYPVGDIMTAAGNSQPDLNALIEMIQCTIQPTTWEDVGGPGTVTAQSTGKAKVLVCTQSREVHGEIAELLTGLHNVKAAASGRDATAVVDVPNRGPAERKIKRPWTRPPTLTS